MVACPCCGNKVDSSTGKCPVCGSWLPKNESPETPVLSILYFSFASLVTFAVGLYWILENRKSPVGIVVGFLLLVFGWVALWLIIARYRASEGDDASPEVSGPYER